ncbi:hypothetical protein AAZX31_11G212100 [Glycine max]
MAVASGVAPLGSSVILLVNRLQDIFSCVGSHFAIDLLLDQLDIMDRGTDAWNLLLGKVIPLRLGYVGVVNRSQEVMMSSYQAVLPGLRARISASLVTLAKEHASYGEITESKAGQGALLLNILSKYCDETEKKARKEEGNSDNVSVMSGFTERGQKDFEFRIMACLCRASCVITQVGSLVFYFSQGHSEHVTNSTRRTTTSKIPMSSSKCHTSCIQGDR